MENSTKIKLSKSDPFFYNADHIQVIFDVDVNNHNELVKWLKERRDENQRVTIGDVVNKLLEDNKL